MVRRRKMTTYGSLFTGIGGFDLAFDNAGFQCAWQVEIDPDCQRVLSRHWPDVAKRDDVKDAGQNNLTAVDIICFGSPCQDLSVAGKREGIQGERSGLFFEAIRVVKELRPSIAVWENVPGAFSSNAGHDFLAVINSFRECGARDIAWATLDAQYFGVAQRRRRVFLVADFRGERAAEILFESEGVCWNPQTSREAQTGNSSSIAASLTADYGKQLDNSDRNGGPPNLIAPCLRSNAYNNSDPTMEAQMLVTGTMKSNGDAHSGFEFGDSLVAATLNSGGNSGGFRTEPGEHLVTAPEPQRVDNTLRANAGAPKHAADESKLILVDTLQRQGYNANGGINHASTQEGNTGALLRALREKVGAQAFAEWGLGILDSLQPQEVLQSDVLCEGTGRAKERAGEVDNGSLSRQKDMPKGAMREVRQAGCERRTPQEWRLDGQLKNELRAYLSGLPQSAAHAPAALRDLWEASEGIGILRQALSAIQKVRQSANGQGQPAQRAFGVRRLTPTEAERLQGFPDGWTALDANNRIISDSSRYRMLGNAVCRPVAEWIAGRIKRVL